MIRHALLLSLLAMPSFTQADAPKDIAGRLVAEWVKDLGDKQALVREEAAATLGAAKIAAAVPALEKLLHDASPSVQRRAAVALWEIDRRTGPAVAVLSAAVRDPEDAGRREALEALDRLDLPSQEFVPLLVPLLGDDDPALRQRAAWLLRLRDEDAAPAIVAALPTARAPSRRELLRLLQWLGPRTGTIEATLRRLLATADAADRAEIERTLERLGAPPEPNAASVAALRRPRPRPVRAAPPPGTDTPVEALTARLDDTSKSPAERAGAIQELALRGKTAAAGIAALERFMTAQEAPWSMAAAIGLVRIAGPHAGARDFLLKFLADGRNLADGSPTGLARLAHAAGASPGAVWSAMTRGAGDDPRRCRHALEAMAGDFPDAACYLGKAGEWLDAADAELRWSAAKILARRGSSHPKLVAVLSAHIRTSPAGTKPVGLHPDALLALAAMGPAASAALPELAGLWNERLRPERRADLAAAITAIDPRYGAAQFTWLREQLRPDASSLVQLVVAEAMCKLDPSEPQLVPALRRLARQTPLHVAGPALILIGRLGERANAAGPDLRRLLHDAHPYLRLLAAEAWQRVEAPPEESVPTLIDLLAERLPPNVVQYFSHGERLGEFTVAIRAAESLGGIGPPAIAAWPHLNSCRSSQSSELNRAAALAIRRIATL